MRVNTHPDLLRHLEEYKVGRKKFPASFAKAPINASDVIKFERECASDNSKAVSLPCDNLRSNMEEKKKIFN